MIYLARFLEVVGNDKKFRYHTAGDWVGYFWKYHIAVREFFSPREQEATTGCEDFLFRLRQGIPITPQEVPRELLEYHGTRMESGGSRMESGGSSGRNGTSKNQESSSMSRQVLKEWAGTIKPHVDKAAAAVKAVGKTWGMKALYPNGVKEALGPLNEHIRATVAGKKDACPRIVTYGKCNMRSCKQGHSLEREPTRNQSRQFTDWVIRRCDTIVQDPSKV